jgi:hypothetical protein
LRAHEVSELERLLEALEQAQKSEGTLELASRTQMARHFPEACLCFKVDEQPEFGWRAEVSFLAIGESGAFFTGPPHSPLALLPVSETEKNGIQLASRCGAKSLAELRAKSADDLLSEAAKMDVFQFGPNIDGYFLSSDPQPNLFRKPAEPRSDAGRMERR